MDLFKKVDNNFITFPKTLKTYKWYKPFFIIAISLILYIIVFPIILEIIFGSIIPNYAILFHSPDADMPHTVIGLSNIFMAVSIIPAVYIPTKIIYKIPFSKMVACIRNWDWKVLFRSMAVFFVVYAIFNGIYAFIVGKPFVNHFSIPIFIVFLIIVFAQCFAEELMFRGMFMQSFGSWFKMPIVSNSFNCIYLYNKS